MEPITKGDLLLINRLSKHTYINNQLLSKASQEEKAQLDKIKKKLKDIAFFFSEKYKVAYGPFETSVVTGNDIAIGGTRFKRIWSGIFKGAKNKQYAAQISFVLNSVEACLDVGFYFGRAQGHSLRQDERLSLETQLKKIAISLANSIKTNDLFKQKYNEIFDFGFSAHSGGADSTSEEWPNQITDHAKSSQIIAKIYPNDFEIIEHSTIDSYVSQVIFLMGAISNGNLVTTFNIEPLTPEQRAKQAERLAEIGTKGEIFIMKKEEEKLRRIGIIDSKFPRHVALESTSFGYDILSLDENKKEIFIEVKTTTRKKEDLNSKKFFISNYEFETYEKNKSNYKLYRVYDIENNPFFELIDLEKVEKKADGFICTY